MSLPEYWYEKLPDDRSAGAARLRRQVRFLQRHAAADLRAVDQTSRPLLDNRNVRVGIKYADQLGRVIDEYFRGDYLRMRTTADGYGEFTHPT
jgi:microcin C transport system substrate-binding protein